MPAFAAVGAFLGTAGGAAAIGAAGTLAGAAIQAGSAKSAVKAQVAAQQENNLLAERIRTENRALFASDIQEGGEASDLLADFIGLSGDGERSAAALQTFLNSTGYKGVVDRGVEAIAGNRAAGGVLNSGATIKAGIEYGQERAMSYADRWLNLLSDRANRGTAAKSAIAGVNNNYASALTGNNNAAADARSNGAIATGNAWGGALSGVGNILGRTAGASSYDKTGTARTSGAGATDPVNAMSYTQPTAGQGVQTTYPLLANPLANVRF